MHLDGVPQPRTSGMRVVILEPDAETRDSLRRATAKLQGFLLVGESQTWAQCELLLNLYVPELLLARIDFVSPNLPENIGESIFPVIIGLRATGDSGVRNFAFDTIDLPVNIKTLSMTMEHARTEIYRRKLEQLSVLLQRYTSFSRDLPRYLSALRVEGEVESLIPAELVMFIAADGNYVRVHTSAEVYEIRDTMSSMASKLNPAQFTRVHRSFVVSRNYVRAVVRKEGAAFCILLSNGVEIPVGPNYRSEVDNFDRMTKQLSA